MFPAMEMSTQSCAIELIRLADPGQSVTVQLRSTTPTVLKDRGPRYYDATVVITSDFVNGTVILGFSSEDLTDWGRLLDAVEEAEREPNLEEPFTADWPRAGRTAYLRFIADDPYVVEIHDGTSTGIVVSVPLDMREEWIAESRDRFATTRAALGEIPH